MSEPTLKKTHELLEKLTDYVMHEVPTKKEMDKRFDQVDQRLNHVEDDVKETKQDVKLILDGMDSQAKEMVKWPMNLPMERFVSCLMGL